MPSPALRLFKIISGGQTGADRAGLTVAIQLGMAHGGWCPKGRKAEDGRIPDGFKLEETESAEYPPRTEHNVQDADGTIVFTIGALERGSRLTVRLAVKHRKPHLHLDLSKMTDVEASEAVRVFLAFHRIEVLNVAGNRESKSPRIGARVEMILIRSLALIGAEDVDPQEPPPEKR